MTRLALQALKQVQADYEKRLKDVESQREQLLEEMETRESSLINEVRHWHKELDLNHRFISMFVSR